MTEKFLNIIFFIFAPFIFIGVINRAKSIWAGRKGPSVFQPFYDFVRLLKKGEVISTTSSFAFLIAPSINMASVIVAGCLVPMVNHVSLIHFNGDFILFAYMLAAGKFFSVISAMDTGSSFSGMGASREVTFSSLVEPAFFIVMASIAAIGGAVSFDSIFLLAQRYGSSASLIIILSCIAFFIMMLVEGCRVPVDDPNTHLELTMVHEVMVLDNSGPDFGFIQYASAMKLIIIGSVIANLIMPLECGILFSVLILACVLIFLAALIGIIESVMARFRMVHVPQFIFLMTAVGLILLSTIVLMNYGGLQW
jgi:formate hydrogenlyase subunit 4